MSQEAVTSERSPGRITPHAPSPRDESAGAVAMALVKLAIPIVVSNIFFTVQISIDRLLLSWKDGASAGAAFAAAMLFYAPVTFLTGTAGFTATFVSQYFGAGLKRKIGPVVAQALWFSFVAGLLFMTLALASGTILESIGHAPELIELEGEYFTCLCFCALPVTVNAVVSAFFAGIGRPSLAVWINVFGCLTNGLLDWWLIFGGLGVEPLGVFGAGLATAIGSYVSFAIGLLLLWNRPMHDEFQTKAVRFDARILRRFLSYATPNGVQGGFDVVVWSAFTMFIGWLGTAPLAAASVVFLVNAWFFIPMLGLAQAVSVFVGQKLGEDRPEVAERGVWTGLAIASALMTTLGLVVALVPGPVLVLFRSEENPELWAATAELIPKLLWFVAIYSFFDSMALVFAFALRGAGDSRFVSVATIILGVSLLLVPGSYVASHGWGLFWTWTCAVVYLAGLAFTFLGRFLQGRWRSLRVIEPAVTAEPAPFAP